MAKGLDDREAIRLLSRELDRKHRLVRAQGIQHVGGRRVARYRFRHQLFQDYLYGQLDEAERALHHETVAEALVTIYQEPAPEIAVQLARHYEDAGLPAKACRYLIQAGDHARTLYALDEAIQHYEKGLALLKQAGDYERASRVLMKLGLAYHSAFDYVRSRRAYDESFALERLVTPGTTERASPRPPHALRLNVGSCVTLDPAKHNHAGTASVQLQLLSGLVALTPELDVVPDVAQSWEILDGGLTYVFHLRNDARWNDGQPVTAADFASAWRRALDPEIGAPGVAHLLFDIVGATALHQGNGNALGVHVIDDQTLRVELRQPTGYFLQLLTSPATLPVPHHLVVAYGEAWAEPGNFVGNGPFQLMAWERGGSVFLERNPHYHGRFAGNVEQVEIDASSEPERCLARYEANELDIVFIHYLPTKVGHDAARRHASDFVTWLNFYTIFLQIDTSRPPLDDRRVRQALALGVDKERLAAVHCLGQVAPATGGLVPPGLPGHVPDIASAYDLEAARRLLDEAGYPGGRGLPQITTLVDRYWSTFVDPVLDGWVSNLGLNLDRESVDFYWRWSGERAPQIIGRAWGPDYPDPDDFMRQGLQAAFLPEMAPTWRDNHFEKLLDKARRRMVQKERMALYRQAEKLLVRETPIIPLTYLRSRVLVRPWIRNFRRQEGLFLKDIVVEPH